MSEKIELSHMRVQVWYDGTFQDYADMVVDELGPVLREVKDDIYGFYYFTEEYSDKFEHHVQVDLMVDEHPDRVGDKITDRFTEVDRPFYWTESPTEGWWCRGEWEKTHMLHEHMKGASGALKLLRGWKDDKLEHSVKDIVRRRFHLLANQHGLTYKDEFLIALSRAFHIAFFKIFGKRIYKAVFLRD